MSRVVRDQREKFETNDLFRKLSKEFQVKYAGFKDKPPQDRCVTLLEDCEKKQLEIAFAGCGLTLTLLFKHVFHEPPNNPNNNFVAILNEDKIVMENPFIFNGVCVIFKGWLDLETLEGRGRLEFDSKAAKAEELKLMQQECQKSRGEFSHGPPSTSSDSSGLSSPVCHYEQTLHDRRYGPLSAASLEPVTVGATIKGAQIVVSPDDVGDPFPATTTPHWKKRIRQNSEPMRPKENLIVSGLSLFNMAAASNFFARDQLDEKNVFFSKKKEENEEDDEEEEGRGEKVLDLSINSKTHPPSGLPRVVPPLPPSTMSRDVDETLSSFGNMTLPPATPAQAKQVPGVGLIPKKKYSRPYVENPPPRTSLPPPPAPPAIATTTTAITTMSPPTKVKAERIEEFY